MIHIIWKAKHPLLGFFYRLVFIILLDEEKMTAHTATEHLLTLFLFPLFNRHCGSKTNTVSFYIETKQRKIR